MAFFGLLRQGFFVSQPLLLCVTALALLELALVDKAGLSSFQRSACLCLLSAGIKGMHHHCLTSQLLILNTTFPSTIYICIEIPRKAFSLVLKAYEAN